MSKRRVYTDETLAIMDRYFHAIEVCRERGLLKSMADYFRECDIDSPHFYTQRNDRNRGFFEVGWLVPLIRDCHVSSYWLMTGIGDMF